MNRIPYEQLYMRELAAELASRRHAARLSQCQLAARCGVPESSISRYESASRDIPSSRLAAIARGLNVPLPDLVLEPAERARRALFRHDETRQDGIPGTDHRDDQRAGTLVG